MQKLYYGGPIITMEDSQKSAEAVLVDGGRIAFVGSLAEAEQLAGECERADLQGRTLMPAFIDAHSHFSFVARNSAMVALGECGSFEDIASKLRAHIEANPQLPPDALIMGYGYDQNLLAEGRHPDKFLLDSIAGDHPVFISHVSLHMGVASSSALALLGIDAATPDPDGGRLGRVGDTSEPDGYLEETALTPVFSLQPGGGQDMPALCMAAQRIYLKHGITTVQEGASAPQLDGLLKMLADSGNLAVDVVSYIIMDAELLASAGDYTRREYERHYRPGGYKIILDGSPQARTAWMSEPYELSENDCSYGRMTDAEVLACTKKAVATGTQLLAHCNGDAASEQFLNMYEQALAECGTKADTDLRPVMVHCQTVREDQLDRMAAINMIPSIFIGHTYYWGDVHLKNFGEARGSRISPAASALRRGMKINFHQDSPVTEPNMLHSIWCAVNRITRSGRVVGPEQCIGVYDALKAVTINAAYQYFEEDTKGSLKAGKLADMVVLDRSPLDVPAMEIKDIKVLRTIKEGELVYNAE